jgi:hypothetical protein
MKNKLRIANFVLACVVLLASCNLPSAQAGESLSLTAAALTIQALTSATPGLPPPTSTLIGGPSSTPFPTLPVLTSTPVASPTTNCNLAQFVADVTIPDGTILAPNQAFVKKWRLRNIGSCTWTGFNMIFDNGDAMGGPASKPIGTVTPGQEVDLEVNLTAPGTTGNYRGYWRIATASSVLVPVVNGYQGTSFYVDIKVQNPATVTSTTGPFAVTSVNYVIGTWNSPGFVNCPKITANITTNGPGTVEYHWVHSDGPGSSGTLVFISAGTQSVSVEWSLGSVWAPAPDEWMGIYIDTPNHQDFGHATMTPCTSP